MKTIKRLALPVLFLLHLIPVLHQIVVLILSSIPTSARLTFDGYPLFYAVLLCALLLLTVIFHKRILPESGFTRLLVLLLPPIALLNAFVGVLHAAWVVGVLLLVESACTLSLPIAVPIKLWKRIISFILSFLLALVVVAVLLISFMFGDFGESCTVQTATSPDATYIANLIDIDEGALGGSTEVEILKKPVSLIFGRFTAQYYCAYDSWAGQGVLAEMDFYWLDDETLLYGDSEIRMPQIVALN